MRSDSIANAEFSPGDRLSLETEFQRIICQKHSKAAIAPDEASRNRHFKTVLQQASRYLIDFLTGQSSLSIRALQPATGELKWIVYDPSTSTHLTFYSEQAVRVWLENRYRESAT